METQDNLSLDPNKLPSDASPELAEEDKAKIEKVEHEKKELINRVASGLIQDAKDRVAYILNNNLDARNSDDDLVWSYWQNFESDKFNGYSITKEQYKELTKPNSITRLRAKIQNEYKLYQADATVRKYRGMLKEENAKQAVDDKPQGLGMYSVYIDETGKTQEFLSVGSLWLLEVGSNFLSSNFALGKWVSDNKINHEFHFNEINKNKVVSFKGFFSKFLSLNPSIGFKLIVVKNTGFSDKNAAITDLTFHLINKGIEHENLTGRAPLPRVLQVWMDEDDPGSDKIKIENLKERISSQKIEGLYVEDIQAVSSAKNYYIQIIDLFTGAVNRKLHNCLVLQ